MRNLREVVRHQQFDKLFLEVENKICHDTQWLVQDEIESKLFYHINDQIADELKGENK